MSPAAIASTPAVNARSIMRRLPAPIIQPLPATYSYTIKESIR